MLDRPTQPSSAEPIEILLVDDTPSDGRRLLQDVFETTEYETELHRVTTGEAALEFLTQQATEKSVSPPDVAVLDLNLPDKDEYDVLETIKDKTQFQCLPMILLTSSDVSKEIAKCYGLHINAYVPKPTDPHEFASLAEAVEQFWVAQVQGPPIPQ